MYSYMRNLNSHPAYRDLRAIRLKLSESQKEVTGHALAEGLMKYSERGEEYIKELRQMIRVNKAFMSSAQTS
jgi:Bax protein